MDIVCSNDLFINDSRNIDSFKKTTLSSYEKTEVLSLLEKKILEGQNESSCFLAFELLVSGHLQDLWQKLSTIAFKYIRNPQLLEWIYIKTKYFDKIIEPYTKTGKKRAEFLHLRNSQLIRNLITEFVLLLVNSAKKDKIELLKKRPNKERDFEISRLIQELRNKDNIIIGNILGPNDPKEVGYVANELAHCLNNKNIQKAMYWIEWLLIWEKMNIAKFKKFDIQSREINGIDQQKYRTNVIWLIWSVILFIKELMTDRLRAFYGNSFSQLLDTFDTIWLMYLHNWKPTFRVKKQILIYLYINYLLNPQDMTIKMLGNIKFPEFLKLQLLTQEKIFLKLKEKCQYNMNYLL